MKINFFEEFPDRDLGKARLIKFKSLIFIASKNEMEFSFYKARLKKINPKLKAGYWPILERSYWISPFAYTKELKKLHNEIKEIKSPVLIDLELPFLNKKLFLNIFSFFRNKKIIKNILKNKNTITAEYACPNNFVQKIYQILGISYKQKYKKIIMFYTSMIKNKKLKQEIAKTIVKQKPAVGIGTIAIGILGNEPILSPKKLNKDLDFLKKNKIKEAYIFQLAGLNKEYLKIINKYK